MDGMKKLFSRYLPVFLTGAVLGIIGGVSALNILVSYRIDNYHQFIRYLENTINDNELKLKKLQESVNKSKFLIKDIQVVINFEGDELDRIELEKAVRNKYSSLLGKEVKSIDIDMVAEVVDKRIMRVNNKEYKLTVTRIVVSDVLKVWVDVS